MRRVNNWEDYLFDEDEDDLRMVAKRRRHTMHAASAAASIASTAVSVGKRKGRQPGQRPRSERSAEFKKKSEIGIACCIKAIDGILIWIHKPTEANCKDMGVGPVKFFCGRKKKYGLNMQAICDSKRRFLWVDIRFPGATSDYFAFEQTELFEKLQTDGFLRAGLCIFGDAAYVNAPYMCVPYRNVAGSDGSKDAYNFFQSQLRINIECAFGMLVHRFGILRKPFPVNVSVGKINAAVLALCKLHNFCIDSQHEEISSADICDSGNIMMDGGMVLPRIDNNEGDYYWDYDAEQDRLDGLLDGGEHFDDISRGVHSVDKLLSCSIVLRAYYIKDILPTNKNIAI
jgi:hypothetical protein